MTKKDYPLAIAAIALLAVLAVPALAATKVGDRRRHVSSRRSR